MKNINICKCCGKSYGPIPQGSWMAYISGWHTVYIETVNDRCTALAYDNDPAKAAEYSWKNFDEIVKENFGLR